MIRNAALLAIAACSLIAAGCNTISGVGRDLQSAGGVIADTFD